MSWKYCDPISQSIRIDTDTMIHGVLLKEGTLGGRVSRVSDMDNKSFVQYGQVNGYSLIRESLIQNSYINDSHVRNSKVNNITIHYGYIAKMDIASWKDLFTWIDDDHIIFKVINSDIIETVRGSVKLKIYSSLDFGTYIARYELDQFKVIWNVSKKKEYKEKVIFSNIYSS